MHAKNTYFVRAHAVIKIRFRRTVFGSGGQWILMRIIDNQINTINWVLPN